MKQSTRRTMHFATAALAAAVPILGMLGGDTATAGVATAIPISQTPLTVAVPAHPQVILALANSESMDGDLGGAIMTGSGSLGASLSELQASSSPVNYTIPAGFTPPLNPGAGGVAPYTSTSGGNLADNAASRMNVAKAGITSILNTFMANADFALLDYRTGALASFTTWLYVMSPNGAGFSFTGSPGASRFVTNPCYNVNVAAGDRVGNDCNNLKTFYGASVITQPDMIIGASSDDPAINDVLYAGGGIDPVCLAYNSSGGGPNPANPYGSLAAYNSGSVLEFYNAQVNSCALVTGPTNAGFVPFSNQVMYMQRGFGFYSFGESANSATTVVPMTSSGAVPTAATVNAAIASFSPFLQPETQSTGTTEIKSSATQSPTYGLLTGALALFNGNPATSNGCTAQRYVVLLTDGLPTMDSNGANWPPLGSASAAGYGVTATFNGDGSLAVTNDQALTDAITAIKNLQAKGIKTYIIGLGAGVDPTKNPTAANTLTAMAVAGGTSNYFAATSPAAVANDMQVIMAKILAATQSTSSVAVNSTYIHQGAVSYQAQFTTSDSNQDWTGNLSAFPIDTTTGQVATGAANAIWNANTQLDAQNWNTGRLIATWDPVVTGAVPFRWTPGTPATGIGATTLLGQQLQTNMADPLGSDALEYLRGRRSLEAANGGPYRTRTHVLGDIVDSSPLYVGPPSGPYQVGTYFTFENTFANRPAMVYVGANDGMLHAFDATTGSERFAYIPHGVYANLIQLTNTYYNQQHHFFVDGSPQASDVQFSDNTWHTLLFGGENAGGNSIYALDVTDPATINSEAVLASRVLWEFTDANMGLSYSVPAIANANVGFTVFFGNGYNSPTQTPYLYALDPKTGAVRVKLNLCNLVPSACDLTKANGLSSVVLTNSTGAMGNFATLLYAGDLQGNVWRVDISNKTPSNWTATVLFQARDGSGVAQPITTVPAVSLNPLYPHLQGTMVYVGTGQMLGLPDLTNTQTQTIYGIYDSGVSTTAHRADLIKQTMSVMGGNTNLRVVTSNAVDLSSKRGWYVDLSLLAGERVVTDPVIDSGAVIVTSNTPSYNTTSCSIGSAAWLNEFNYANGGAFTTPQFDTNGDNKLDARDAIASGMSLGNVFASTPTVSSLSNKKRVKEIGLSSTAIQSVVEKGTSQQRTSWWEIRGIQ